jgi:hypothetical protein
MKTNEIGWLAWCGIAAVAVAATPDRRLLEQQFQQRARYFEVNRGQIERGVDFVGRTATMEAALKAGGAEFALGGTRERLNLRLDGARTESGAEGLDVQTGVTFYLMDQKQAAPAVQRYGRVRYRDVYPGIDLVYYFQDQNIEYDFVVRPGADPRTIRLAYDGARGVRITDAGELAVSTAVGEL